MKNQTFREYFYNGFVVITINNTEAALLNKDQNVEVSDTTGVEKRLSSL